MEIILTNDVNTPMYEQIAKQIKSQIIVGKIEKGEMLPSIRSLAKELKISVITTTKAYDKLEKDGFIFTVKGKGCYVSEISTTKVKNDYLNQIEELIFKATEIAKTGDIKKDEIIKIVSKYFKE